jgi:hypothetical protein
MASNNKVLFQHYLRTREALRKHTRRSRNTQDSLRDTDRALECDVEVRDAPAHMSVEVVVNVVPRITTSRARQEASTHNRAKSVPPVVDRTARGTRQSGEPRRLRSNSSGDCASSEVLPGWLLLDTASAVRASVQQSGLPALRRAVQLHAAETVTTEAAEEDGDKAEAAAAAVAKAEVAASAAACDPASCDIAIGPISLQRLWADPAHTPPPAASDDADAALAWAVRCLGGNRAAREARACGFAASGGLVGRRIDIFLPLLLQWVAAEVRSVVRGTAHIRLWCDALSLLLCAACWQLNSYLCFLTC